MWYSNIMQFPFQESHKEYAQISARSTDSEGSACNIRTCSGKTSEDGQAESEHGLLKHQKNLRSEAEALKFSWYYARSTSRSEDKKMLCIKLFDSDEIQTLFIQTSDQKQV